MNSKIISNKYIPKNINLSEITVDCILIFCYLRKRYIKLNNKHRIKEENRTHK
jgi:hypothetical protein